MGLVALPYGPSVRCAPTDTPTYFDVWEYRVEGNTVLDQTQVERAVYPFLGPHKRFQDVEKAQRALAEAYRKEGFGTVMVNIPEQTVKGGVIHLEVVEGRIERVRITGARFHSPEQIRKELPSVVEGEVPNISKVQRELQQVRKQSADREVTPVMRAGRTPGTVELELQVKDHLPLHGSVEINGRNSVNTSRTRVVTSLRYDNLWQRFHSASLQYQISPEDPDNVQVWAGTYVMPVMNSDMRLAFYGVGIDSSSSIATAGALSVIGTGQIFGLRLIAPLPATGNYYHSLTLGFDHKSFEQDLKLVGSDADKTPITYHPFTVRYEGILRTKSASTNWGLGLNFSIRGLGNDQQEFEDKRFKARSDYLYLTASMEHGRKLPLGMELRTRMKGQWANSALISNEQFAAGGANSVRGYFESQALSDHGVFGSLEMYSPQWLTRWSFVEQLQALIFFDGAQMWVRDALPGTESAFHLAGAGVGLRLQLWKHVFGSFDWAYALFDSNPVEAGDSRAHFRVSFEL